jgi:hypothetical protein
MAPIADLCAPIGDMPSSEPVTEKPRMWMISEAVCRSGPALLLDVEDLLTVLALDLDPNGVDDEKRDDLVVDDDLLHVGVAGRLEAGGHVGEEVEGREVAGRKVVEQAVLPGGGRHALLSVEALVDHEGKRGDRLRDEPDGRRDRRQAE